MRDERYPGEPMIERLTPDERDEFQIVLLRRWQGRRRRAQWEITHGHNVPVKRFDLQGRRILSR
ncbi:MAG TPA: hypothetical protein VF491_17775 [Vicinamibacterales bacterium]